MRIFIVAGGTGGHLFPAIRLAEEIKLRNSGDVRFITSTRKQDRAILEQNAMKFYTLPIIGTQAATPLYILNFTARLIIGTIKSLFLLLCLRPSTVIGFGGYVSGPILLIAALFNIKTIIHEQNVYPGRTNMALSRFVDRIALGFAETREYLRRSEQKIIVSGNPLRRGLKKKEKAPSYRFTLLVMGGSQGSHILNEITPVAVGLLRDDKKKILEIIHISGYDEKDKVVAAYRDEDIKAKIFSFVVDIDRLYNESDFVIARAGATTVSELLYMAKPCILVPYPHARAHQRLNAKILNDIGLAVLIDEERLSPTLLCGHIATFMDREILSHMSGSVKTNNYKDACDILLKELIV